MEFFSNSKMMKRWWTLFSILSPKSREGEEGGSLGGEGGLESKMWSQDSTSPSSAMLSYRIRSVSRALAAASSASLWMQVMSVLRKKIKWKFKIHIHFPELEKILLFYDKYKTQLNLAGLSNDISSIFFWRQILYMYSLYYQKVDNRPAFQWLKIEPVLLFVAFTFLITNFSKPWEILNYF